VGDTVGLTGLLVTIARLDSRGAVEHLNASPSLATAKVARSDEFFLAERLAQDHEGDTALHAAGFTYDPEMARELIIRGADIRAKNRRGAEPLDAEVMGVPGTAIWNPTRQRAVIARPIEAGADPNAAEDGGVTPLHRAVRNRCSAAADALVRAGADPRLQTTAAPPRPISLTGQPGAVARASPRPRPNNKLFSSCSRSTPRERRSRPARTVPCPDRRAWRTAASPQTSVPCAPVATVRRAAPIFPVRDLRASLAHYERLGFTTREYEGGGYAFVARDGVEIHLGVVADAQPASAKHSAYLWVDDADALAQEWRAAGAEVHMPEDTEWGQHEGALVDPDGNVLRFGSPIS
jgi:predicted enzyme related to lactoylglutathione lyase